MWSGVERTNERARGQPTIIMHGKFAIDPAPARWVWCNGYGSPGAGGGEEHLGLHCDVPTWGTGRLR